MQNKPKRNIVKKIKRNLSTKKIKFLRRELTQANELMARARTHLKSKDVDRNKIGRVFMRKATIEQLRIQREIDKIRKQNSN